MIARSGSKLTPRYLVVSLARPIGFILGSSHFCMSTFQNLQDIYDSLITLTLKNPVTSRGEASGWGLKFEAWSRILTHLKSYYCSFNLCARVLIIYARDSGGRHSFHLYGFAEQSTLAASWIDKVSLLPTTLWLTVTEFVRSIAQF